MPRKTILPRPPIHGRSSGASKRGAHEGAPKTTRRPAQGAEALESRSSFEDCVEALLAQHGQEVRARKEAHRRRNEIQDLMLGVLRRRQERAEAQRLRVAQEEGRRIALLARIEEAKESAASQARPSVERIARQNAERRRLASRKARLERHLTSAGVAQDRTRLKRSLFGLLAVGLLTSFGLGAGAGYWDKQNQSALSALRDAQQEVIAQTARSVEALEKRLNESRDLSDAEKRRLRKALAELEDQTAEHSSRVEQAQQTPTPTPGRKLRNSITVRPSSPKQAAEVATHNPEEALQTSCLEGDPLCFSL